METRTIHAFDVRAGDTLLAEGHTSLVNWRYREYNDIVFVLNDGRQIRCRALDHVEVAVTSKRKGG